MGWSCQGKPNETTGLLERIIFLSGGKSINLFDRAEVFLSGEVCYKVDTS